MNDYSNYLYYKGGKDCPIYGAENAGKMWWWGIEADDYRFRQDDSGYDDKIKEDKEYGKLSNFMLHFIKEYFYEPTIPTMTWEEVKARAEEMYVKGVWSTDYIYRKEVKSLENATIYGAEYL